MKASRTRKLYQAGQRAIRELGLEHNESQLQNLALYIFSLEQENAALRQRVDLLSPMRKAATVVP
jgi:hypothetical protein